MKTAIIIHGMPSREEYAQSPHQADKHWIPWVKTNLEAMGYEVYAPEMPEPYAPAYEQWKNIFEQFALTDESLIIGHSLGAAFLVRWLSEHDTVIGELLLVAPWLDPNRELAGGFCDFTIDSKLVAKTKQGITLFYSTDDDAEILQSVERLEGIAGVAVKAFSDKGHFTEGDGVSVFPELLAEVA